MGPKKKSRKRFYLLVTFIICVTFFFFIRSNPNVLGINLTQSWNFQFMEDLNLNDDNELETLILKEINEKKGEFSVVVEFYESSLSAKPEKQVHLNEKEVFPAASLYKLFLMAAVMQEIEDGRLNMDQKLSASKEHLTQVLGFEEYGYKDIEGDITFTVEQALERIGRLSDNYAAIILAEKVGWGKVQDQAKKVGADSTIIKSPITTTSYDISLFLKDLYLGKVVSFDSSKKIVDFLSRSQINNRIPKELSVPSSVMSERLKTAQEQSSEHSSGQLVVPLKIAHKTGELSRVRHDAGIVYLPDGGAYIIVLMSKNLDDENEGAAVLARVSKVVYDYCVARGTK